MDPRIEEKDDRLEFDLFGQKAVVHLDDPVDGIRQLVRIIKILELRVKALENK